MSLIRIEKGSPVDIISGAVGVIDSAHLEVHAGRHFYAEHNATINSGANLDVLFVTPAAGLYAHMVVSAQVSDTATMYLYEGVTTSNDGTALGEFNRNRASSIEATVVATHTPTVTDTGTLIRQRSLSSAVNETGANRDDQEIILAPETKYLLRIASGANSNVCYAMGDWYEHAQRAY